MRTRRFIIGLSVLLALAACNHPDNDPVETRHGTSLPAIIASPELSAIDSLMWRQPDSALVELLNYLDNDSRDGACTVSTNETFDNHYAQLLASELLYKNDYAQTNRPALLQAVTYFDSLTFTLNDTPSPKRLIAGSSFREGGTLSLTRNDNLIFLDARAHYINAVGYYENDSIEPACAEYLKALDVMEEHFDEKDLVGKKARFMTYTYNRLGDMFSLQYMMEPSIVCYNDALSFYLKAPTSPTGVSGILNMIGIQYDMMGEKDTAMLYYKKAMEALPNTNNLTYRNIISSKALLSYQMSHDAQSAMRDLNDIVRHTNDENERLARYLTMGDI